MNTGVFMVHPGPLPTEVGAVAGHTLRAATDADVEPLAELLTAAFGETWDLARVNGELLQAGDVPRTWVVEDADGRLLATSSELVRPLSFGASGCVHWVGTHPDARGAGLGEWVVTATLAGFAENGFSTAVLSTSVDRVAAVRLYLRLGFLPSPRNDEERVAWSGLFRRFFAR